jgi:parallel beta-helix repeat protein
MRTKILCLLFTLTILVPTSSVIGLIDADDSPYNHLVELIPMQNGYIRSDGTVEPQTLPIEKSGNRYTLIDNIVNYTIEIQIDDIVLDGNGHSMIFSPIGDVPNHIYGNPAINIINRTNVLVQNFSFTNSIEGSFYGIGVINSSNIFVVENYADNEIAIKLQSSTNCSIIGNTFRNCQSAILIYDSIFLDIEYNKISSDKHYYSGLFVVESNHLNIRRNEFSELYRGIYWYPICANNSMIQNNFLNNSIGIQYVGGAYESANQTIHTYNETILNNYWSGNGVNIQSLKNFARIPDDSAVDQAPLLSPLSVDFNASLFSFPSFAQTPSPKPTSIADGRFLTTLIIIGIFVVVMTIAVFVYFKKHKR